MDFFVFFNMRLKEEYALVWLAVIDMFLLVCTVMVQISDMKVNQFEDSVRTKELLNIHSLSVLGNYETSAVYYLVASFDPKRLQLKDTDIEKYFKEAMESKKPIGDRAVRLADEINALREKGTPWPLVRSIFYSLTIFFVLINLFGHIYLLNKISKRIK